MKYKKSMIIIMLVIFLFSIAAASASDVNETAMASENSDQSNDLNSVQMSDSATHNTIESSEKIDTLNLNDNEEKLTAGNIWYVNSSAANGEGTLDNPFNNLKDTITASSDNDIIRIASGTYSGENNANLIIDKNLTLERYGDGEAVFDGSGSYGIWEIQAKSINMTGFTFQNGYGGNGGALLFKSELINSNINANFNNNYAGSSGGAIYFAEFLTNVNIIGNFTKNNARGTGYDGEGGGAICFFAELNHVNIIGNFTDNIAQSYAGANYFKSKITNVNIFGNYNNNTATGQNGGANWFSALLNVNIIGNYSNNKAYFGGANVFYEALENVNITGNYINNTATNFDGGANQFRESLKNVAITGDYSYNKARHGGANFFNDNALLNNVNITGNYCHNEAREDGGAIYLGNPSHVNIIGNYTNNTAKTIALYGGGGAIFVLNSPTELTIAANFYNNTAVSEGAAILFYNSMSNVDVTGNFINNKGKSVIYNWGTSNSIIHDSIFINNSKINVDGSGTIKIVNTWFGNNATNYDTASGENRINFENWLFLNATVDSNIDDDSKITNITFKLSSYNSSGVSDYNNNLLNPINLTITATNGNIAATARLGETIQFTPTSGGTATVTATVENAIQTVEIPVKGDFDLLQDLVNNESLSVINLERNYTYNQFDTMTEGVVINRAITINGNGYTINANGKTRIFKITSDNVVLENITFVNGNTTSTGGAVYFSKSGGLINCNFTNNSARFGGAIDFEVMGTVSNCNFTGNTATQWGGAIYMYSGSVENCNFTGNTATQWGGAVYFFDNGEVTNCNFTGNNATTGSAIYFYVTSTIKIVSNSRFLNNRANSEALEVTKNDNNITITFTGNDNLLNAIYSNADVTFTNVTYWNADGIANTGSSETKPSRSNKEAGQNITVGVVVNDKIVLNEVKVTDENGMIVLDISVGENYYISVRHDTDSYYTEAEKTISNNTKFNVNVTSQTTHNKTVNITAKSNIFSEFMEGKLLFILPNGDKINATYAGNGTWWAVHTFDDARDYKVNASYIGLDNVTVNNATISIRFDASVEVNNKTLDLLIDDTFTVVAVTTPEGLNVSFVQDDSGVYSIDEKGKVTALRDGEGSILVKVEGNTGYAENSTIVNVTVSKIPTKITVLNDTLALEVTDEIASGAALTPADAGNLTYSISNSSVVKVEDGKITALAEGEATITVSFKGDKKYLAAENKTINVTVSKIPTEISVDPVSLDLFVGDETVIVATLTPGDAGNVTFTSSDDEIVLVEDDGNVIANGKGQANITVSFTGDDKYAASNKTISVTVRLCNASVTVDNDTLDLKVDETYAINATKHPDTILLDINYTSSNSSVATVDKNGIVTAVGEGTAVITVSVGDGEIYALNSTDVTVTVSKIPTEITVLNDTLALKVTDEIASGASLTPADAGNVTYAISNSTVVKVENGKIIALAEGEATITVSFKEDDKYLAAKNKTIKVTVELNDARIIAEDMTLDVYSNATISPVTSPEGLEVEYASGNVTIAEVDSNGVVTAHNAGNTTITITTKADGVHAVNSTTINVSVNRIDSAIDVNDTVLNYGETTLVNVTTEGAIGITAKLNGEEIIFSGYSVPIPVLNAGTYNLTVTTIPDENYKSVSKTVKVTVLKQNATADISIPQNITAGENVTVNVKLPDDAKGNVTLKVDGVIADTAEVKDGSASVKLPALSAGNHTVEVSYSGDGNYNPVVKNTIITVNKISTNITAEDVSTTYNVNKNLVVTLTDGNGNPIAGVNVTVELSTAENYTTGENGQIKVAVGKLTPKSYTATVTFAGNEKYLASNATAKVVVKKATPKLTAKAKTFKTTTKTKKFTVTLKDNTGKPIAKAKVTLKVGGKTYHAKTNSKGKATFKITKLSKKGKYKAVITYKANKYYNKATKKVKITVKSVWKTVSKGSKDKNTVKKIQNALKANGYYLSYKGHYLVVDGIYQSCTERSVREFQRDNGLKVTGKVDEKTAKKLKII